MSRDVRRLRVFHDAHRLVLSIYQQTHDFPRHEWFGLRAQMRRAAVSIPTNLVEGNARSSTRDYLRFLHIALGSACELGYLARLARELGFADGPGWQDLMAQCDSVARQLQRLVTTMEQMAQQRPHN